jgi:hypothetical protein
MLQRERRRSGTPKVTSTNRRIDTRSYVEARIRVIPVTQSPCRRILSVEPSQLFVESRMLA